MLVSMKSEYVILCAPTSSATWPKMAKLGRACRKLGYMLKMYIYIDRLNTEGSVSAWQSISYTAYTIIIYTTYHTAIINLKTIDFPILKKWGTILWFFAQKMIMILIKKNGICFMFWFGSKHTFVFTFLYNYCQARG